MSQTTNGRGMRWESLEEAIDEAITAHTAFFDTENWTVETTRFQDGDYRISVYTHVETFDWFGKRVDWQLTTYLDHDANSVIHVESFVSEAGDRREEQVGTSEN